MARFNLSISTKDLTGAPLPQQLVEIESINTAGVRDRFPHVEAGVGGVVPPTFYSVRTDNEGNATVSLEETPSRGYGYRASIQYTDPATGNAASYLKLFGVTADVALHGASAFDLDGTVPGGITTADFYRLLYQSVEEWCIKNNVELPRADELVAHPVVDYVLKVAADGFLRAAPEISGHWSPIGSVFGPNFSGTTWVEDTALTIPATGFFRLDFGKGRVFEFNANEFRRLPAGTSGSEPADGSFVKLPSAEGLNDYYVGRAANNHLLVSSRAGTGSAAIRMYQVAGTPAGPVPPAPEGIEAHSEGTFNLSSPARVFKSPAAAISLPDHDDYPEIIIDNTDGMGAHEQHWVNNETLSALDAVSPGDAPTTANSIIFPDSGSTGQVDIWIGRTADNNLLLATQATTGSVSITVKKVGVLSAASGGGVDLAGVAAEIRRLVFTDGGTRIGDNELPTRLSAVNLTTLINGLIAAHPQQTDPATGKSIGDNRAAIAALESDLRFQTQLFSGTVRQVAGGASNGLAGPVANPSNEEGRKLTFALSGSNYTHTLAVAALYAKAPVNQTDVLNESNAVAFTDPATTTTYYLARGNNGRLQYAREDSGTDTFTLTDDRVDLKSSSRLSSTGAAAQIDYNTEIRNKPTPAAAWAQQGQPQPARALTQTEVNALANARIDARVEPAGLLDNAATWALSKMDAALRALAAAKDNLLLLARKVRRGGWRDDAALSVSNYRAVTSSEDEARTDTYYSQLPAQGPGATNVYLVGRIARTLFDGRPTGSDLERIAAIQDDGGTRIASSGYIGESVDGDYYYYQFTIDIQPADAQPKLQYDGPLEVDVDVPWSDVSDKPPLTRTRQLTSKTLNMPAVPQGLSARAAGSFTTLEPAFDISTVDGDFEVEVEVTLNTGPTGSSPNTMVLGDKATGFRGWARGRVSAAAIRRSAVYNFGTGNLGVPVLWLPAHISSSSSTITGYVAVYFARDAQNHADPICIFEPSGNAGNDNELRFSRHHIRVTFTDTV